MSYNACIIYTNPSPFKNVVLIFPLQDKSFKQVGDVLLPGYQMAVRNCPWMSSFWLGLVRGMERTGRSPEEVIGEGSEVG